METHCCGGGSHAHVMGTQCSGGGFQTHVIKLSLTWPGLLMVRFQQGDQMKK